MTISNLAISGVERSAAGVAIPTGYNYCCVVPQEDVTITSITIPSGYSTTNYAGKTLAAGIPFYAPFTAAVFTGAVDCYRTSAIPAGSGGT